MGAILSISINTFREAIRNKIFYALAFFALLIIVTGHFFADISLHNEKRVLWDIGSGLISFFALALSIFTSASIIHKEIDKKTIYLVLSKPVERWKFIAGKTLGLLATVYSVITAMLLIFIVEMLLTGVSPGVNIFKAFILIMGEVLLVVSVSILFSSFSSPFITGMMTIGAVFIGRMLPDLKQILFMKYEHDFWRNLAESLLQVFPQLYLFIPNGHDFNGYHVSITTDFVTWGFIGWSMVYTLTYSCVILAIASLILSKRDLT
ncbi:ABC transporter permease [Myxococcota bacterium]|nr:ABC transporter permease [Myxococcota bacterium]MBU1382313.1 ABC transporter permease [Myxococcota bacterium]MBU1498455.1 ABC transporter permease [Myxococcota bacterium]